MNIQRVACFEEWNLSWLAHLGRFLAQVENDIAQRFCNVIFSSGHVQATETEYQRCSKETILRPNKQDHTTIESLGFAIVDTPLGCSAASGKHGGDLSRRGRPSVSNGFYKATDCGHVFIPVPSEDCVVIAVRESKKSLLCGASPSVASFGV